MSVEQQTVNNSNDDSSEQSDGTIEHGEWLNDLPVEIPEMVNHWELKTQHGKDYMETEMFTPDYWVEWKSGGEYPYYLQLVMNEYPVGTVYSLKIERPLGGTRLLEGKTTSENPREIIEQAIQFMADVDESDLDSPFYNGEWFPTLNDVDVKEL